MKTELTIKKIKCDHSMIGKDIIIPDSENSYDVIKSLPYAEKMACQINYKGRHNLDRHDLYHACVKLVSDNLGKSIMEITEACKIDCRWIEGYTHYKDKHGNSRVNVITKTTSFSKMTLKDANDYYSKAFDVLAGYLKITTEELVHEAKLRMQTKHYCILCGKVATQKHHRFSQTKWAIEKYGKKLIDDNRNIEWLCPDCHSSHANIPKELIWSEKKFRLAMGLEVKEAIKEIFSGVEV